MTLRCVLDGLLLPAEVVQTSPPLIAYDGEESFPVEAMEALYYEIVDASPCELLHLEQARYRTLRKAADFELVGGCPCSRQAVTFA